MPKKILTLVVLVIVSLSLCACALPRTELDITQERLADVAPLPDGTTMIGQTFVARHDNLNDIEIILAKLDDMATVPPPQLILHLRESVQSTTDIASAVIDTQYIAHNTNYHFHFEPQRNSAGRTYYLLAEGTSSNRMTIWQSGINSYNDGSLFINHQPLEGDLYFKTYYEFGWDSLARYLEGVAKTQGWTLFPALLLFFLPGYILLSFLYEQRGTEPLEDLALMLTFSLASYPVFLIFTTVIGLRMNGALIIGLFVLLLLLAVFQSYQNKFQLWRAWGTALRDRAQLVTVLLFAFLFIITLISRFVHIRAQVLPLWVDSVHHNLIAKIIAETGRIPQSYQPYMPTEGFKYHFGFHANAAFFQWLTNLPMHQILLTFGQILNAVLILPIYLLVKHLTGDRVAGMVGALIVAVWSIFPAYFVSWGRYTQLMGMILLPGAVILTMELVERSKKTSASFTLWRAIDFRLTILGAVALAGLFLTHYRVLVFYFCFLLPYLLYSTYELKLAPLIDAKLATVYRLLHRDETISSTPANIPVWTIWWRVVVLGAVTFVLSLPWLWKQLNILLAIAARPNYLTTTDTAYNAIPWAFVTAGHNKELLALSIVGAILGLLYNRKMTIMVIWMLLVVIVVNPEKVGLPPTWFVNNATAIIALFVPFAIFGGYLLATLANLLTRFIPEGWRKVYWGILSAGYIVLTVWGAFDMFDVINPVTILATPEDVKAIEWLAENTPPDAKFLINCRHWQSGIYMGVDGGWWIQNLTDRDMTMPPVVYSSDGVEYIEQVTDLASFVSQITSMQDETVIQRLRDEGITHVYLGVKSGAITPAMLIDDPHFTPIYNGAVWIFEFEG